MAEQWLSIVEYARTFKISDMTVRRRIKTGRLEAVLQDGKYFIPIKPSTTPKKNNFTAEAEPPDVLSSFAEEKSQPTTQISKAPEIKVIKGHPTAPRVYPEANHPSTIVGQNLPHFSTKFDSTPTASIGASVKTHATYESLGEGDLSLIPESVRKPLANHDQVLIDTRSLLMFCETAIRKFREDERKTAEHFRTKLSAIEAGLFAKDQEIKALRQQIEDMQLLIKILERRKGSS